LLRRRAAARAQVEKLAAEVDALGEPGGGGGGGGGGGEPAAALDARARVAERLAGEVARLNFHAARGQARRPAPSGRAGLALPAPVARLGGLGRARRRRTSFDGSVCARGTAAPGAWPQAPGVPGVPSAVVAVKWLLCV
jgi:hypothetical protein